MSLALLALLGTAPAAELIVGTDAPTAQETVDLAVDGDVVVLPEGSWSGPVVVDDTITLTSRGGTLTSSGEGHTLVLDAPGVVVDGLTILGSGEEMNTEDACIRTLPGATGSIIQDSRLENCLFGIWIHTTVGVRVLRNYVGGRPDLRDSDKGNGIHLFDASQLEIRGNNVVGSRDGIYVSATEFSTIADNDVSHQRYGIHYMYSYDNTISGNTAHDNNGGMALMGSFRLKVHHNKTNRNKKQGLLFRDIQYCDIHHNEAANNLEGMFFFSSLDNDIHHNVLRGNQAGARVWAGSERNRVWANSFIGNREALFYVSASDQQWGLEDQGGNYWSDHIAWDQDGDGIADRPYRADTTVATVLHKWPQAVLLLNSPAMELVAASQARLPVLRTPSVVDPWPLARPPEAE